MSVRISIDVSGYYDWEPCPPGTEITDADVKALRVKQLADDRWAMRVTKCADTHHDVGIPESQIESRLAALGDEGSRDAVVAELLRSSMRHHLHQSHLQCIHVIDDVGDQDDLEKYLNVVFRTKGGK